MTGTNAHGFKSCLIKIPTSWLNFTISQTLSEVADFVDSCFFLVLLYLALVGMCW